MTRVHPDNDSADTWVQRAERSMDQGSRHNMNTTPGYNTEPGYIQRTDPPLGHRMPVIRTIADVLYAIQPAATIAFAGPKGTGKDTTARRLWDVDPSPKILQLPAGPRDASGKGAVTMQKVLQCGPWYAAYKSGEYRTDSVAAPLYQMISTLTGWTIQDLQGPNKETIWSADDAPTPSLVGWSPRKLLEHFGSGVVRKDIGPNHWVELLKGRLAKYTNGITVLTDVRFIQEAQICDLVIELRRPGKDYDERPDSEGGHESRRRLPAHLIDATFHLTPDMDYHLFAEDLILKVQQKRADKARWAQINKEADHAAKAGYPDDDTAAATLCRHLTSDGHGEGASNKGRADLALADTPYLPGTQEALNPPLAPRQRNADDMGYPDGPHAGIERGDA